MAYERILIVEENLEAAAQIADTLVRKEYDVVSIVSSGDSALWVVENVPLDLILLDIMLKGTLDAVTTASEILSQKDLPIIFMTPYSDADLIIRSKDILPYGFLTMPIDEQKLISTIRMALTWHDWNRVSSENEGKYNDMYQEVYRSMRRKNNSFQIYNKKIGSAIQPDNRMAS